MKIIFNETLFVPKNVTESLNESLVIYLIKKHNNNMELVNYTITDLQTNILSIKLNYSDP